MNTDPRVDDYIAKSAEFARPILKHLRALVHEAVPPIANLREPDAAFDLAFVRGEARAVPGMRWAMSNSFAFGGTNAVLVAGRIDAPSC